MCGICGVLAFEGNPVQRTSLEGMNLQIRHRGPDDAGFYANGPIGLAMRRLSIIDVKTGQQPITNEDKSLWLVYNGELYNYRELQDEVKKRGHTLRSNSDTETIVHLYEEFGKDCLHRLRGMFAFALWDNRKRTLFVARDRLGIKPLYFCKTAKEFLFASEVKAILAYPGIKRAVNHHALPEYLAFGYVSGAETLYKDIYKLLPGRWMEIKENGVVETEQYWDAPNPAVNAGKPEKYYVQTYREMLEAAVESHLMSEVPLGVFLSGGIDSSAVAALMTKHNPERIKTFSVGYEDSAYSELSYAKVVAEHLGSDHHEVLLGRKEFFELLPKMIWHEDEPIAWPSSVALYVVARLARQHVTVVLTGEGSDETLAGYSRYSMTQWNGRFDSLYRHLMPKRIRKFVREGLIVSGMLGAVPKRKLGHTFLGRDGESWADFYFDNFYSAFALAQQRGLLSQELVEEANPYAVPMDHWSDSRGDLIQRMLYTDIKTYLVELLMKQDNMSMAASIESRVPFLDHVLVEFALSIPSHLKVHRLEGKVVLKKALEDLLPGSILYRKKLGFPTPWRSWLAGPALSGIEELLLSPRAQARGLFDSEYPRTLFEEQKRGITDHSDRLWRLLNLELWQRVCVDGDSDISPSDPQGRTEISAARI